jgi:thiamine-phosphate pyrophosphorylase
MRSRGAVLAARLYLIIDAFPKVQPIEAFLSAAIAGGVGMVQLREKNLCDLELCQIAQRCATTCQSLNVPFIVNDRVDIALASGADGVHVGQDDLPVSAVRKLVGNGLIVGLSTHSREQIDAANTLDVDYIGVGPIYETPTKQGRPAVGVGLIRYAAEHAEMPFFAIGGLDQTKLRAVADAGATRVSVLRWIAQASDPADASRRLIEQFSPQMMNPSR